MGIAIMLRGGSRDGFEDYVYSDSLIRYGYGETYKLTDEKDAKGRTIATLYKPEMAAVGRRVSEWANSPTGRNAIMKDEGDYDAGVLHPEAPLNRFTIEHSVLHDTLIGRHVIGTPDSIAEDGPNIFRNYLFSLMRK